MTPQERSIPQVIAQPLYDVPIDRLDLGLATLLHKDQFTELYNFEDFSEIEKDRLADSMKQYLQNRNKPGPSAVITLGITSLTKQLLPSYRTRSTTEPADIMTALLKSTTYNQKHDLETLPEEDLLMYGGFLVEMDRALRVNDLGGPVDRMGEIAEFDQEVLKDVMGDTAEGMQNFQSGDLMYKNLQDAMLEVRRQITKVNTVYVPADFIQLESGWIGGELPIERSIFLDGRQLVKPELLAREPVIIKPDSGKPQKFGVEDEAYWELGKIPEHNRYLIHRRQLVELYRRLQVYGDPAEGQAYGRAAGLCLRTEGLAPGSYLPAYGNALHKATELYDIAMAGIGGKVIQEFQGKNLLSAKEKAALMMIGRQPLVFAAGKELDAVEIGPGVIMDCYMGNVSPLVRNPDGSVKSLKGELLAPHLLLKSSIPASEIKPFDYYQSDHYDGSDYYVSVAELGFPIIDASGEPQYVKKSDLDDAINASGQDGMPVLFYDPEYNPFRKGNTVPLQLLYTSSPIKREEEGGGPFIGLVKHEIKHRMRLLGRDWKDITGFPGLSLSGKPLDVNNPLIKLNAIQAGPLVAGQAKQDKMLDTALFSAHGLEWGAFQGLLIQLQFLRQADRMLASDNIDEGTIAQAMREQHAQKYQLTLPIMLESLRTYSKQINWFKVEQFDPFFVALADRKGMHPSWRNDLHPDKTPEIAPIMYTGDGGVKTIKDKMKELSSSIEALKDKKAQSSLSDVEKSTLESQEKLKKQLELGTAIIKGSLYAREEWGFSRVMRNNANAIVNAVSLAEESSTTPEERARLLLDARRVATENVKYYIENFNDLSPAASYRGSQEILPFLAEIAAIPEYREAMNLFGFDKFMQSMGLDEGLRGNNSVGLSAFSRAVSARSVKWIGVAEVDKDGKNTAKYAEMAAGYGEAMLKLGPSLNNALNAAINKVLGEKSDSPGGFKPDEIPEALWTQVIDLTMLNLRTEKEGAAYVEEIIKAAIEPSQGTGYVSRDQGEELFLNLLHQIELSSQAIVESNLVFIDERTKPADKTIIGVHTAGLKNLHYNPKSQMVTNLIRRSGFGTNTPDITTGKAPYVSMGDYPVHAALVKLESSRESVVGGGTVRVVRVEPVNRKIESLAAFSHRGEIHLAMAALLMYGKDKLLVNKYQTDAFEALMLKHGYEKSVIGKAIKAAKKAIGMTEDS